jgi:divalent metal cation (Fe/Co/Zn/Cd) transporter
MIYSDLVFIQDATGSMGSYIASGESSRGRSEATRPLMQSTLATRNIETICETIVSHEKMENKDDLRVGVSTSVRSLLICVESNPNVLTPSDCCLP